MGDDALHKARGCRATGIERAHLFEGPKCNPDYAERAPTAVAATRTCGPSEAVEVGYLYGGTAALVMGVNAFIRRESHRWRLASVRPCGVRDRQAGGTFSAGRREERLPPPARHNIVSECGGPVGPLVFPVGVEEAESSTPTGDDRLRNRGHDQETSYRIPGQFLDVVVQVGRFQSSTRTTRGN